MDYNPKLCEISDETKAGWKMDNIWKIFGCMKPVLTLIGKSHNDNNNNADSDWEIPFEVFSGWHFENVNFIFVIA